MLVIPLNDHADQIVVAFVIVEALVIRIGRRRRRPLGHELIHEDNVIREFRIAHSIVQEYQTVLHIFSRR